MLYTYLMVVYIIVWRKLVIPLQVAMREPEPDRIANIAPVCVPILSRVCT